MTNVLTPDEALLALADEYRGHNSAYAAYLAAEAADIRAERTRKRARCRRCTWSWYPTGDYPWRCVDCPRVAVSL